MRGVHSCIRGRFADGQATGFSSGGMLTKIGNWFTGDSWESTLEWKADYKTGALVGIGIVVLMLLADGGLLWRVVHGPINGWSFLCAVLVLLSLPAIVLIAYRIYNLAHLRYSLDRNRLLIVTGALQQIIPLARIERVLEGDKGRQVQLKGITWPGYAIAAGMVEGLGLTLFYGVEPPQEQVIVVTPTLSYGISVPDVDDFMEIFAACRRLGPNVEVEQTSQRAPFVHWPIWRDHVAHGVLLGGIVLNALLFALLCFRYPRLPPLLPMHYDIAGQVDRIASRREAFALPLIGLLIWTINGLLGAILYRGERMASYLAWSGGLFVQVFFLLALWNLVT